MKRLLGTAGLVLLLDQGSKNYVLRVLDLPSVGGMDVFAPYLRFAMAWNRGVNFGLFANDAEIMRWLLAGLAVVISLWLIGWVRKTGDRRAEVFAGLVVGGAAGNALDRLVWGGVVDFLNVSCCGLNNPYAFNFADIAVFMGAFGLVLFSNTRDKNA